MSVITKQEGRTTTYMCVKNGNSRTNFEFKALEFQRGKWTMPEQVVRVTEEKAKAIVNELHGMRIHATVAKG